MRLVVLNGVTACVHYHDDQCCGQWEIITYAQEMKFTLEVENVKYLELTLPIYERSFGVGNAWTCSCACMFSE